MKKAKLVFIGISIVTISLTTSACVNHYSSTVANNSKSYWYEIQNRITTNDLQRLQQKVPFTIIIPSILPDDVDTSQRPELIMIPDSEFKNDIDIQIIYAQMKSTVFRRIEIDETNSPITWGPNEDMEYVYLNYSGISVLEQKSKASPPDGQIVTALYYSWNENGIDISIDTDAFEQDEAREMVESMIKQS